MGQDKGVKEMGEMQTLLSMPCFILYFCECNMFLIENRFFSLALYPD